MIWEFFLQIIGSILGLWLADRFVPGVNFTGPIFIGPPYHGIIFSDFLKTLVFVGIILGALNFFVKPILNIITLPLRIITFNLFSFIIAMFLIWLVDIFSPELIITGIKALFLTTIIILIINYILTKWLTKNKK